ncbi:MAG: two-component sensor histidine kinase, partial [Lachnospiraceae bacterium]|nr:two-component sensor histidine kinase [Lachnospiraceae bacterium]
MKSENKPGNLRLYLVFSFITLLLGTLLLCGIGNYLFLAPYYRMEKEKTLIEAYEALKDASEGGEALDLEPLSARYNLSIIVLDTSTSTVSLAGSKEEALKRRLLDILFEKSGAVTLEKEILKTGDGFELWVAKDERTEAEYLEIWGILPDEKTFLIQSPLESMQESASVANRFLLYTGLAGMFLGGVAVWLLSSPLEKMISRLQAKNEELALDLERQKKLEELLREFIANASHELKTPLSIIQGYAEGLSEGACEDTETRREYSDIIADEASKMDRLVKNLLALNELEGGSAPLQEDFDLSVLVSEYLSTARILAREAGGRVSFDGESAQVHGDPERIRQVVENYYTNAIHHLDGEKLIRIKIERKKDGVRCSVFNTGLPIPEEALPHVWEKFYKADKARTRSYGGNG